VTQGGRRVEKLKKLRKRSPRFRILADGTAGKKSQSAINSLVSKSNLEEKKKTTTREEKSASLKTYFPRGKEWKKGKPLTLCARYRMMT